MRWLHHSSDSIWFRRSEWFLPFALSLAVIMGIVSFESRQQFNRLSASVEISQSVVDHVAGLLTAMDDAETGQRGFLLTGQEEFLQPFYIGVNNTSSELKILELATQSDHDQHSRVEAIRLLAAQKLALSRLTISLSKSSKLQEALRVVRTSEGKRTMDQVRILCQRIRATESIQLTRYSRAAQMAGQRTFMVTIAGSLSLFASLAGAIVVIRSANKQRDTYIYDLHEQHFYASSLLESGIGAILITDSVGIITDANKQMEALTGYARAELIGAPFRNYSTDPELAEAGIQRALSERSITDYELTVRARDGKETIVSYNATTFYNRDQKLQGVFATARDITENRRLEQIQHASNVELQLAKIATEKDLKELKRGSEALHSSEATARSLFENASQGILTVDQSGTVLNANAMAEELFNYSRAELVGSSVEMLLPESFRSRHIAHRASFAHHPSARPMGLGMDLAARRKDGSEFPVEISLSLVTDHQQKGGVAMAFISDITARRNASREQEALVSKLESALSEKTVLLREVHHRVKNNLAVIEGLLGMQAASIGDDRLAAALEATRGRICSMALVHDYLYATGHLDRVNFGQYVQQIAKQLCSTYATAPDLITVIVNAEQIDLPVHLAVPCGLILNELLSNAFKHAFPNGRRGEISVSFCRVDSGNLSLRCQDDGLGMPESFERTTRSLGLEIVEILAKQIDGQLKQGDRSKGSGTDFELRFPSMEIKKYIAHA